MSRIWRWASGLFVGAFVVVYLAALLLHNTFNIHEHPQDDTLRMLDGNSQRLLSATGTTQRWNMFAPNVGTLSYTPIVVIVFKDGSRVALHSIVEPELPNWEGATPIPNEVEGDARLYAWCFHIADGRIRKYESRAANAEPAWRGIRTNFTRWRAEAWLRENPGRRADIARIELWRAKVRHPGYGHELCCESVELLPIFPQAETHWPVKVDYTFPFYRP
ncbi:MAG: hypothetical protein H6840_04165 [Planctomycetes bacterium]|nr:hypothetical protein [Planctomycetota bacterium]